MFVAITLQNCYRNHTVCMGQNVTVHLSVTYAQYYIGVRHSLEKNILINIVMPSFANIFFLSP